MSPLNEIIAATVEEFGSSPEAILKHTRGNPEDYRARAVAMYVYRMSESGQSCPSLTEIGRVFARDRTTVRHALNRVVTWRGERGFHDRLSTVQQRVAAIGYPGGVR